MLIRKRHPRVGLAGHRTKSYTLTERMEARTVKTPSCWNFQGCKIGVAGYGQIMLDPVSRKRDLAHRVAWQLAHGPIPPGLSILHRCDNPRCVNPSHLFMGTQAENVRDCLQKDRRNAFGRQKLTIGDVRTIRRRAGMGETHASIARAFGVARHTVSAIVSGRSWATVDL